MNSIPKESGLTPHQKAIGRLVTELREQWHCLQDNLPCYVAQGVHLKLTAKLLATWAECIVSKRLLLNLIMMIIILYQLFTNQINGTATIEIAPTLPDFAAQHATKKSIHPSTTHPPTFMPSQQMFTTYPIHYPPPQYYSPYMTSESSSFSNFNNSPSLEIPVPSIEEFLKKLDKDEGDNGDFIQFINAFNEQNITVKHIKDLDDNEFQILGVKTIGWRKTIQGAAKQYK